MPHGGVLTPKLKPGLSIKLSVIDAGCGMDVETMSKAVEPFYSTKEFGRGMGLGLSMVHGLAAQLDAGFALTSAPGEGTRVDLYLPVAGEAALAGRRPTREVSQSMGRRLSVLLIDDEPLVRTATAEMIRDLGHHVEEAGGGAEGLARLEDGLSVGAVITDYMMPRMDGGVLSRRVAQIRPGPARPADHRLYRSNGRCASLASIGQTIWSGRNCRGTGWSLVGDEKVVRFPGRKPTI